MPMRNSFSNALLIAGAVLFLTAVTSMSMPVAAAPPAAPPAALTETAEPTVVTATAAPTATATAAPTATATAAPTATATAAPTEEPAPRRADPAVSKRAGVAEARVGDLVPFTITITNNGNADARDVVVEDNLPPFLELVSATADRGQLTTSPRSVRLFLGTVSPGDEVRLELLARAIAPAAAPDNRNQVALTSANGSDNPSNNSDSAEISIIDTGATATPEVATLTPTADGQLTATALALTATPSLPSTPEQLVTTPGSPVATPAAGSSTQTVPEPARLPVTSGHGPSGAPGLLLISLTLLGTGVLLRWRRR